MISGALGNRLGTELGGVFYLHGDDEHGKAEAARALVEAHLDPATRDFNHDLLRGSEVGVEALASTLGTPPMMAEWRVVELRETEALAGSPRTRGLLLETAQSPPPGLALILLATKPRGSSARFYRDLADAARALEFRTPAANDLPAWLMASCRERFGRTMEEDAARALAQAVGGDLSVLARELEKLTTLAEKGAPITLGTVEAAGTRIPRQDRWEWFDRVGERRFTEAREGLPVLLEHGETGVGLTIGLGTHLLRLGIVVGGGKGALESILPPNQRWLAKRYVQQGRGWRVEEVEEALEDLLRVDRLLKSSGLSAGHLLEGWLLARATRMGRAA
jgi:DNA polymerase III delta subunit